MKLLHLRSTTRIHQWWKPKATNLLLVFYTCILYNNLSLKKTLLLFPLSVITILGIGAFGHFINDWFDVEKDRLAHKPNRVGRLSKPRRRLWLTGILAVAFLPWLLLPFNFFSIFLMALEFFLLLAYAVPPVRLKERAIWSVFIDAAYAYSVPALLAAHTFFLAAPTGTDILFVGLLFIWQTALGVRHYFNHLALDRPNDLASGIDTLATRHGNRRIHQLVKRFVLPLEVIAFLLFVAYIGLDFPLFAAGVLLSWLTLSFFYLILALGRDYSLWAYRFSKMTTDRFYQHVLPLLPLLLLSMADWRFSLLLLAHLLMFSRLPDRFFFQGMQVPRNFLSRYVIYWPAVLLLVPVFLVKKLLADKKYADANIREGQQQAFVAGRTPQADRQASIAMVNINRSKYTETFIWELIPRLPYKAYLLHGGALPLYDDDDRHFLSNWKILQQLASLLENLFHLEENYFLRQSIGSYLEARKVKLVLAQFGPVGAQMQSITRDLGIPLIVYFHGYDVFHREILEKNLPQYRELFGEAEKIIAVSASMLQALLALGAPAEKLIHLPAFVRLELFPYTDHSTLGPHFLAVGRFAETKSPHLTILAFQKVLAEIPEATLTFIGKGGGGELFEACLILVRALRMEKSVFFEGVQTHEQVAGSMRTARVFVQHSLTTPENGDREGKPVAIMEAMAAGLPVVATDHSGIPELIENGVSGFLVPEYDIGAMYEKMLLLAKDDALVARMGRAASAAVRNNQLIAKNLELLSDIVNKHLAG